MRSDRQVQLHLPFYLALAVHGLIRNVAPAVKAVMQGNLLGISQDAAYNCMIRLVGHRHALTAGWVGSTAAPCWEVSKVRTWMTLALAGN